MIKKRYQNSISLKTLIFILWLCCISFSLQAYKIAEAGDPESFQCTLTIQRTDCNEKEDDTSSIKIGFTDNGNATIIPAPPPPPGYCIHASIDPNNTKLDHNKLPYHHNTYWGWERALIPIPDESAQAQWGLTIRYEDPNETLPLDPNEKVHLEITWDPKELTYGLFLLIYRPEYNEEIAIDMHDRSSCKISFQKIVLKEQNIIPIEIYYFTYEPYNILGIICVGGTKDELALTGGLRKEFYRLGYHAAKSLRDKMLHYQRDNINFIPFSPPINDIDSDRFKDPFDLDKLVIKQKERLRNAIVDWVPQKWGVHNTIRPILFIYLVDHGYHNGSISIDANFPDFYEGNFSGEDLREYLLDLKIELKEKNIDGYEIIIIIEACYSGSFIEKLGDLEENWVAISATNSYEYDLILEYGDNTFSWHFWENFLTVGYDLWEAFVDASEADVHILNQQPQFFPKPYEVTELKCNENVNGSFIGKKFLIDCIQKAGPKEFPNIESVKIQEDENSDFLDPNDIKPFVYNKLLFSVTISNSDYSITNAWTDIIYTDPNGKVDISTTDPNKCNCSTNVCTFSPDYCFYYPGAYEFWVHVRGENNEISTPYPLCFEIPMISDDYEPNNTMEQAKQIDIGGIPQSHYLIDNTDIDWIRVFLDNETCYRVEIIPKNEFLSDPNLYNIRIFRVKEVLEKISAEWSLFNDDEIILLYTELDWQDEEPSMVYLEISSGIDSRKPLPYEVQIVDTSAYGGSKFYVEMDKTIKECLNIDNLLDQNKICINAYYQGNLSNDPDITMSWEEDKYDNTFILIILITTEHTERNYIYTLYIHNNYIMTLNDNDDPSFFKSKESFPLDSSKDFDNDGFTNGDECSNGTDPLDPLDPPPPDSSIIPLSEEWNLISFQINKGYYEGANPTEGENSVFIPQGVVLQDVGSLADWLSNDTNSPLRDEADPDKAGDWQRITSFDSNGGHILDKDLPSFINTLKYISAGYGYWIKMNAPGRLVLKGQFLSASTPLELQYGWNLIGYIPKDTYYADIDQNDVCPYDSGVYPPGEGIVYRPIDQLIPSVFTSIEGKYRRITSFDCCGGGMIYDTQLPSAINTLHYIGPKYGYWVKIEDPEGAELIYPDGCQQ